MRDKKRCIAQFTFYDRTGIQAYLEKMAARGWLLEKMTPYYWQFKRIEPGEIHFAVTYYAKGSEFDPKLTEGQMNLIEYCRRAGWIFVDSTAQIQIFYNEAESPVPIETDAFVELENIHKSAKKNFLLVQFLLLGLALLELLMLTVNAVKEPLRTLGSNAKLFSMLSWSMVVLLCTVEITGYFVWYRRAKKAAETDGSFVKTRGTRTFQLTILAFVLIVFALYLFSISDGLIRFTAILCVGWMVLLIVFVNLIKSLLKRKKVSRDVTRTVTFLSSFLLSFSMLAVVLATVFQADRAGWFEKEAVGTYEHYGWTRNIYHDVLPLTVEDMLELDYDGYTYEADAESSLFLTRTECRQRAVLYTAGEPDLNYVITKVKVPWMYDFCLEKTIEVICGREEDPTGYQLKECTADIWGAEEAFQYWWEGAPMNSYLVCYETHFVIIHFDWEPDSEQLSIAGERLAGAGESF